MSHVKCMGTVITEYILLFQEEKTLENSLWIQTNDIIFC